MTRKKSAPEDDSTVQVKKNVAREIERLAQQNGGRITPDQLIEAARNKNSPLYGEFEWDLKKAAMEHWRNTARRLIRSVITVEVTTEKIEYRVPMFVRDPGAAPKQGYIHVRVLKTDRELARDALVAEFTRVKTMLSRAKSLALAMEFQDEIEQLESNVNTLIANIATRLEATILPQ